MFEQVFKKKRKSPNNPKNNKDDVESLEAPDADGAVDSIDAALREADRIRDEDSYEKSRRMLEEMSRGCGCGSR